MMLPNFQTMPVLIAQYQKAGTPEGLEKLLARYAAYPTLIDQQIAMISTGNFDQTNLCIASENPTRCNRDFSMVVNDAEVVNTLERIFEADVPAADNRVGAIVEAYDKAVGDVTSKLVAWTEATAK